jgi:cytochrome c biogenesis protein CcmG/thiol:disulfide interchange protein DsbE
MAGRSPDKQKVLCVLRASVVKIVFWTSMDCAISEKGGKPMPRIVKLQWIGLFCLVVSLCIGCTKKEDPGDVAPEFSLEDLSGNTVTLTASKGSIVLLDFWATWCPPCLMSIPELVGLQQKYREKGLVVFGISLDDPEQISNGDLLDFKKRLNINYKILRADWKVMEDYFGSGSASIPTMFVIDREGRIVEKHIGFRPGIVEESLKELFS